MGNLLSKTPKNERPESIWGYNPVSPVKNSQMEDNIGGLFLSSIPYGKQFITQLFLQDQTERKTIWFRQTSVQIDGFLVSIEEDATLKIVFTIKGELDSNIEPIVLKSDDYKLISNKLVSWKNKTFLKKRMIPENSDLVNVSRDVASVAITSFQENVQGVEVFPNRRFILYDENDTVSHDVASSGNAVDPEVDSSSNAVDSDVAALQEFDVEKVVNFNGKNNRVFSLSSDRKSITYVDTSSGKPVKVNLGVDSQSIDFITIKRLFQDKVVLIFIYGKDGSLHLSSHTVERTTTSFTSICIASSHTRDPHESIECEWSEEETNSHEFRIVVSGKPRTYRINSRGGISLITNINLNI
jgi:hypothetical protein